MTHLRQSWIEIPPCSGIAQHCDVLSFQKHGRDEVVKRRHFIMLLGSDATELADNRPVSHEARGDRSPSLRLEVSYGTAPQWISACNARVRVRPRPGLHNRGSIRRWRIGATSGTFPGVGAD